MMSLRPEFCGNLPGEASFIVLVVNRREAVESVDCIALKTAPTVSVFARAPNFDYVERLITYDGDHVVPEAAELSL